MTRNRNRRTKDKVEAYNFDDFFFPSGKIAAKDTTACGVVPTVKGPNNSVINATALVRTHA